MRLDARPSPETDRAWRTRVEWDTFRELGIAAIAMEAVATLDNGGAIRELRDPCARLGQ